MFKSVVKEIFFKRSRGATEEDAPDEDGRYYRYEDMVARMRARSEALHSSRYVAFPRVVHLETIAICNAACVFCPYPRLERKGERMADALIEKIVDDLRAIPRDLPFQIFPYKVSDPLLETRLFDILGLIAQRLPNAQIYLSTNGSALTDANIAQLAASGNISTLNISLNSDDAEEYEALMKLPFERTLSRLEALHRLMAERELPFPVRLTRVNVSKVTDDSFRAWCAWNFPRFQSQIFPRNDWLGDVATAGAPARIPDAPCHRWFDLSVMATGEVAYCCMDGEGQYIKGDARVQNVLEIFNQPSLRRLRETLVARDRAGDPCRRCTYVSW